MTRWVVSGALVGAICVWGAFARETQRATAALLPMTFAHNDHRAQNCITCHHNHVDDTGLGLCIDCHKSNPAIAGQIEDMFHQLCQGCHLDLALRDEASGPVRHCQGCHVEDAEP